MIEDVCGTIAFVTSIIGLVPQVYKSYKTKSTEDVSMVMLINYLVCSVAWVIHGFSVGDRYVFWSNCFGTTISCIAIWQKIAYERYENMQQVVEKA